MEATSLIHSRLFQITGVPTETEIKVLDTIGLDHCRHTTFETELKTIDFSASKFENNCRLLMINTGYAQ